METFKSILLWPFHTLWNIIKFIFQSFVFGVGAALLLAVVAGAGIGLVLVISSAIEVLKTGNPEFAITGLLGALLSGICFKILNKVIFPYN
jgi:hypothetical protein